MTETERQRYREIETERRKPNRAIERERKSEVRKGNVISKR